MIFNIKNWFYISGLFLVLTESADTIVIRSLDRYANEPSCSNTIAYVRQHEPDLLYVHEAGNYNILIITISRFQIFCNKL